MQLKEEKRVRVKRAAERPPAVQVPVHNGTGIWRRQGLHVSQTIAQDREEVCLCAVEVQGQGLQFEAVETQEGRHGGG